MAKRFSKSLSQKLYHSPQGYMNMASAAMNQHAEGALQFSQRDEGDDDEKAEDFSGDKDEESDPKVSIFKEI